METLISLKRSLYRVLYFHKTAELAIDGVHGTGDTHTHIYIYIYEAIFS